MLNKIRKLKEKKGFTLVELIVVIAIIAILTAVLVPLINNWTQQAAYTTLDDAAATTSNTINEAISKITSGGAPLSSDAVMVCGKKTSGGANQLQISLKKSTGATINAALSADAKKADGTVVAEADRTTYDKVAIEIATMLDSTIPNTCCFMAHLNKGSVLGVIYITSEATTFDSITAVPGTADTVIKKVSDFNGHEYDKGSTTWIAVGAVGEYKKY